MTRIAVTKRDDGRLEVAGFAFDAPEYGPKYDWRVVASPEHSGRLYDSTISAIAGALFKRWKEANPDASHREIGDMQFHTSLLRTHGHLFLKACGDCGALYLDGRSSSNRATRRCSACFARQRYRYVQRARARLKARPRPASTCDHCRAPLAGRSDRRFCSVRCRVAAHRRGGAR